MTLAFRDPSIPDSPVARWDPRWKLAALLVAGAAAVSLQSPAVAALAVAAALGLALIARVPVAVIAGRAGLLLLGVATFVALVPLTRPATDPGWDFGWVRVSEPGLAAAAAIALRAVAVGLLALVLVRTAPLSRTLAAAHALRVPGVLVQVANLAYRYTFLLAAEARRTRVALRARGFRPATTAHSYRTMGHAVGSLLVRSGDRADRVADAMRCRGFDGTYRCPVGFRTAAADVLGFAATAAVSTALVLADRVTF
jgi:cobalt/nickel transport system permease protein